MAQRRRRSTSQRWSRPRAQRREGGAEGMVIAFLHAYRNGAHELAAKAVVQRAVPGLPVFCSHETWPIIREYERTITAVIGGYVQPRVAQYLTQLQEALKQVGVQTPPRITKSNGGVMTAEQGKQDCVQMILSGTASGVIGASHVAQVAGLPRCMSLDIGGTSADVAIILDGQPQYGTGERIGDFQIFMPSVSVSSIGEGGGSIASIDRLGVLKVGPESAGSRPGPACYGRGGTRPTITDAFAACGLIGLSDLGYGAVTVDQERARTAIAPLAERLSMSVEETAEAIIRICTSGMYAEVSGLVSRFGIDPREFACLAFGGAGPMLACFLARDLGMQEVLVPPAPGVLSALGGLIADLKNDFLTTLYLDLDDRAPGIMRDAFAGLERRALTWLRQDQGHTGLTGCSTRPRCAIAARLSSWTRPWPPKRSQPRTARRSPRRSITRTRPSTATPTAAAPLQIISVRLVISGETPKPAMPRHEPVAAEAPMVRAVPVWLDGGDAAGRPLPPRRPPGRPPLRRTRPW